MGLDICSKNKSYHASYSGLHSIRWLALLDCGLPEKIQGQSSLFYVSRVYIFNEEMPQPNAKEFTEILCSLQFAGHVYPNLLLHSDCEGSYTKTGEVCVEEGWTSGNSVGLLKELDRLDRLTLSHLKTGRPWEIFRMFFAVVKDAVKYNKGKVVFS